MRGEVNITKPEPPPFALSTDAHERNRQTLLAEACCQLADNHAVYEDILGAALSFLGNETSPIPAIEPIAETLWTQNGLSWLLPPQGLGSPDDTHSVRYSISRTARRA